jgi:hypothetical protein
MPTSSRTSRQASKHGSTCIYIYSLCVRIISPKKTPHTHTPSPLPYAHTTKPNQTNPNQEGTLTLGLDLPIAYPPAPAWPEGPFVTKAPAAILGRFIWVD